MARGCGGWRRRSLGAVYPSGVALLLALVACGQPVTPTAIPTTATVAAARPAGPGAHTTPTPAPTVDLPLKNLTATAYRPAIDPATRVPTSGTVWITHGGPIVDHVSFVDKLRGQRCIVKLIGMVRQPFLHGQGVVLRASGCTLARPVELQSFVYHTDDPHTDGLRAAEEDARGIDPDGRPAATAIDWSAPPHFFRKERAFILFLGDDPTMLALLTALLRPQFAGR